MAYRRRKTGMVGFQHRLTKEDAMKWFQQKVCVTDLMVYYGESKLVDLLTDLTLGGVLYP